MAYIDKSTMVLLFGSPELIQLTDRDGSNGAIVDAVLNQAMTNAESEADSYLGAAYALPLPSVPDVLKSMVGDIARYRLWDKEASEEVLRRYERAIAWFRDVSKGVVSLGIPITDEQPEASIVIACSRTQVFSSATFAKMGPTW